MSLTYNEMMQQYSALWKTFDYVISKKESIIDFFKSKSPESITFIGCGSGYCLCQSAELSAKTRLGISATALPAGDLMLNVDGYSKLLKNTLIFAPSRSGSTSEVVKAIENVNSKMKLPVFAIACVENSDLSKTADFILELPWAYDASVCQTRTVTNLYAANLLVIALLSGDQKLIEDIEKSIELGDAFMHTNEAALKKLAYGNWSDVVILADGEMQGVASEGAMAFTEIAKLHTHYYHLLDVRHGPMVLVGKDTLVVASVKSNEFEHQKKLMEDIVKRGATLVIYSDQPVGKIEGAALQISSETSLDPAVHGIPFIYLPQTLSYFKAESIGINPDNPDGLVAWVKL